MKTQLNRKIILGSMLCLLSIPAFAQTKYERLQAEHAALGIKEELIESQVEKHPFYPCFHAHSPETRAQACGPTPKDFTELYDKYIDILQKSYDKQFEIVIEAKHNVDILEEAIKIINSTPDL